MKTIVEMTKTKETKNTAKFDAVHENANVTSLYIQKCDPLSKANHITVTVTEGHKA